LEECIGLAEAGGAGLKLVKEISASAQQLASGAQGQAATLEETSAAVEELSASVERVSEHAQSQAAGVEQSSSNMHEMESSVDKVANTLAQVSTTSREAMTKAVEDARLNAETLAGAAGVKLGPVRTLNGSASAPPMPMYRQAVAMADVAAAPPAETYQPGEMKFSAMVSAEYDLLVGQ